MQMSVVASHSDLFIGGEWVAPAGPDKIEANSRRVADTAGVGRQPHRATVEVELEWMIDCGLVRFR